MKFIQHIITVGSGGMMAQAITVATMPVLSRLYGPIAYGGWALLMSVVIIFTTIATLRYELAIVLPNTHEEAVNVMAVSVTVTVIMSILVGLLLPLSGPWMLGKGFYPELKLWLWFVPLLILATGLYLSCNFWLVRVQAFGWYSLSQVGLPFLTILCQITAALLGVNTASGLIIGTILGQCSIVFFLIILIYFKYSYMLHSVSKAQIKNTFIKFKMYPFYMTPYTLIGTIRDRLVYFLLGTCGKKVDIGYYNISSRLVNMPNSFISSAIRPVFFQKAANSRLIDLEESINNAILLLAVCIIPVWILFLFHAKTLFAIILGEQWREAGLYAAILSIPMIPLLLGNWLDRSFDVLGKQRLAFVLEFAFSGISICALSFGVFVLKNIFIAICIQAGIMTLYYSYWIMVLYHIASFKGAGLLRLLGSITLIGIVSAIFSWMLIEVLPITYAIILNGVIVSLWVFGHIHMQLGKFKVAT